MRKFIETSVEVIAAFLFFTLIAKVSDEAARLLNVFNILVFYIGYKKGEIQGAVMGMFCGLIYDSFSIGVFGISGISKTLMGYLTGYISQRINVATFMRRLIFMFLVFSGEMLVWIGLYSFAISEKVSTAKGLFFLQPVSTALLALLLLPLFEKLDKSVYRQSQ